MSSVDDHGASTPPSAADKSGFWPSVKRGFFQVERDFAVSKIAILGVLGTLIGAYFQNLSIYNDKVAALAKDDMTAAANAFADASSALSVPLALQQQLIFGYHNAIAANADSDSAGYETANAHAIYKSYTDAHGRLSQNYNFLARKMELYLDWPSNLSRDPATDTAPSKDAIDMSLLNTLGFDCENDMPSLQNGQSRVTLPHHGKTALTIDWYSAKHNVLAIETCFEITHRAMTPVLQWASGSSVDQAERTKFSNKNFDISVRE
jgi:hypothetical protein